MFCDITVKGKCSIKKERRVVVCRTTHHRVDNFQEGNRGGNRETKPDLPGDRRETKIVLLDMPWEDVATLLRIPSKWVKNMVRGCAIQRDVMDVLSQSCHVNVMVTVMLRITCFLIA